MTFLVSFKTVLGQFAERTNKNQGNDGQDSQNSSVVMKSVTSKHWTELYGKDSVIGISLFWDDTRRQLVVD